MDLIDLTTHALAGDSSGVIRLQFLKARPGRTETQTNPLRFVQKKQFLRQ